MWVCVVFSVLCDVFLCDPRWNSNSNSITAHKLISVTEGVCPASFIRQIIHSSQQAFTGPLGEYVQNSDPQEPLIFLSLCIWYIKGIFHYKLFRLHFIEIVFPLVCISCILVFFCWDHNALYAITFHFKPPRSRFGEKVSFVSLNIL